jgi:hypothetical protein
LIDYSNIYTIGAILYKAAVIRTTGKITIFLLLTTRLVLLIELGPGDERYPVRWLVPVHPSALGLTQVFQ